MDNLAQEGKKQAWDLRLGSMVHYGTLDMSLGLLEPSFLDLIGLLWIKDDNACLELSWIVDLTKEAAVKPLPPARCMSCLASHVQHLLPLEVHELLEAWPHLEPCGLLGHRMA